jgi:hypothetical protein
MIRIAASVLAITLLAGTYSAPPASAEEMQSCPVQSSGKKLAGAAKASFLKKCCEGQAAQQKLAGAAKASFLKKCEAG